MDRLLSVFPQERRSGLGAIGQCVAFGLALLGHVSIALALIPMWAPVPIVSAGNPPQAIFTEIILSSAVPSESPLDRQSDDNNAADSPPATGDAISVAPTKNTEGDVASPVAETTASQNPGTVKPVQSTKPVSSKKASSRSVRQKTRFEQQVLVRNDVGLDEQIPDPTQQTFGHNAAVTDLPSTWKSRLLAHLERFKLYPEAAKVRHEEGISLLSFTLDRNGRVLSFFIARSSGSDELDAAAQTMIERASPVPAIPDDVSGQTMQLMVPVRFTVR